MTISTKDWTNYVNKLRRLSDTAAEKMQEYVRVNGFSDTEALINYAYGLVTKYGEASSEMACQMYDAIMELEGVAGAPAIPAPTATYGETAKAINGSLLQSETGQLLDSVVDRLIKQVSADTMLKNAIRDGAYFAWVPMGNTCTYCLMIGAIGWQKAGNKTLHGNHAKHIHAHCDCQYIVDRKGDLTIRGYDPDKLRENIVGSLPQYDNSDETINYIYEHILAENGRKSWKGESEDFNQLRRIDYAKNKTKINRQKREAYAERNEIKEA